MDLPDFGDVVAAHDRLRGHVARTPVLASPRFDERVGRRVVFKCENLQHAGAFKFRGASNALLQLEAARAAASGAGARVVATHSSGNHGAALARAAASIGWRCFVVVPHDASPVKVAAIRAAGAELVTCEPGLAPREAALAEVVARTGAEVVHPFDDSRVIAGQGTAALELLADHPQLEVLTAPVGGGGLLAGSALAARGMAPSCRVVGAEPEVADDAARSFHGGVRVGMPGSPPTIADGLRGSIGVRPYALFRRHVDDVVTVSEAAIVEAMRIALEDLRLLVEPSSAVPIAALLAGRIGGPGQRVGVILSGGNVDLSVCPFLAGRAGTSR
ncbi:MAG: threonine/serine dehydratase [Gammaproteobacteria bacterium]|nr:threonine/serine dehydratase [Gammaproteobacteria bacterium]